MENVEMIVEIRGISLKEGKTGTKYFGIETDSGNLTCFEKAITDELKKHVGDHVKVDIATSEKGFKNIRKFLGVATAEELESKTEEAPKTETKKEGYNPISMYVSYAKDIFLEIVKSKTAEEPETAVMLRAIKLVKMAMQAFECTDEIVA
jgi:hypothetical protein